MRETVGSIPTGSIMKQELGKIGEEEAIKYLKDKGYQILERNYFFKIGKNLKRGEIDIVAKKGETICFVEVKTLKNPKIEIFPEEKINFAKKRKLILAAESWLAKNKIPLNSKWQIDIISIIFKGEEPQIFHFENEISD